MTTNTDSSITLPPSVAKVMNVTELRERILLHLPVNNLFVLQRVSKTWQDTVKASITISQKMFLQPVGSVLQKSLKGTFDTKRITMNPVYKVYQYQVSAMKVENSPSHKLNISLTLPVGYGHGYYIWPGSPNDLSIDHSWRKMLLTQPPVSEVLIQYWDMRDGGPDDMSFRCATGVTLGALSEHCLELWNQSHHEAGIGGTGLGSYMGITVLVRDPNLNGSL